MVRYGLSESLESFALEHYLLLGELPASAAEVARGHLALLGSQLLVDLQLDGKPMAVPAGNVLGEAPAHELRLHHHVLEDLVEEVAEVE